MGKRKENVFLTELTPVRLATVDQVEASMVDTDDVRGVAWSPKYGAWRAYLHVGRKQVHHSLHASKSEAIAARREAEKRFGTPDIPVEVKEMPGAFRRFHKAPKHTIRQAALRVLAGSSKELQQVARLVDFERSRKIPMREKLRLSRQIGRALAMVEYLTLTGDVSVEEIERGMQDEAKRFA